MGNHRHDACRCQLAVQLNIVQPPARHPATANGVNNDRPYRTVSHIANDGSVHPSQQIDAVDTREPHIAARAALDLVGTFAATCRRSCLRNYVHACEAAPVDVARFRSGTYRTVCR
jgi:hypothetical protein